VDLNADLGEGFGAWRMADDDALLDIVTSANVACGFHAGDPSTMDRVCAAAAARGVAIGAQVGYRDLAGFGRRHIDYAFAELRDDLLYQVGALDAFARRHGTRVGYVKPHGALYNDAVADGTPARAVVAAAGAFDGSMPVLGLPGSALLRHALDAGLRPVNEGFADRRYRGDGTLVPRREPGAVLTGTAEVVEQALRLAGTGEIASLCVHGDTPGAVALARAVRDALAGAGIELAPFAA
jgi:5-oxoprolinase (ATP-hydrolysing) subunit A